MALSPTVKRETNLQCQALVTSQRSKKDKVWGARVKPRPLDPGRSPHTSNRGLAASIIHSHWEVRISKMLRIFTHRL